MVNKSGKTVLYDRPFKLGTTSFIVPDHIVPNVKKLGPFFDEIELLVFESRPEEVLPSKAEVAELLDLSETYDLTYNIHLPVDISLCSGEKSDQAAAEDILLDVMDLFNSLPVSTHTLHLEMPEPLLKNTDPRDPAIKKWKDSFKENLKNFVSSLKDPSSISVETLDYPFAVIEDLMEEFNLPICLDIGHGLKYGHDWIKTAQKYKSRLPLVHLHGVDFSNQKSKDHKALDCLSQTHMNQVLDFLKTYTGTVSIEVFNFENLTRSLEILSRYFKQIPDISQA